MSGVALFSKNRGCPVRQSVAMAVNWQGFSRIVSRSRGMRVSLTSPNIKSKLNRLWWRMRFRTPRYRLSLTNSRFTLAVRPTCLDT